MNSEYFSEGFVKGLVNDFLVMVNTVKAFTLCIDTLVYKALNSLFFIYLKSNVLLGSVHFIHLSEKSVHESVHKVFTMCSLYGVI
jgi:hypothetical protein